MFLPNFIFINCKELMPGSELILSTHKPYFVARVFKFEATAAMEVFSMKYNIVLDSVRIPNYNILLCHVGTIDQVNEKVVLGHNVPEEAKRNLKDIIPFYEKERITGNETRQKKFARS